MTAIGWVLYDSSCGICRRWVPFWSPSLARVGLKTAPLQAAWVHDRTHMSEQKLLQDIRVLLTNGTLISGADAYFFCMKRIWWAWPIYAVFQLPILNATFRLYYKWFAANRREISLRCHLDGR